MAPVTVTPSGKTLSIEDAENADILSRLKTATAEHHARLDGRVQPELQTLEGYRRVLPALATAIRGIEDALHVWSEPLLNAGFDLRERSKEAWLVLDERALDLTVVDWRTAFELTQPAAAFGAVYVVEGATLGGQVITREVAETLGITPMSGGRYFFGYGNDTGRMWTRTRESLQRFAAQGDNDQGMIKGAINTFGLFERAVEHALG